MPNKSQYDYEGAVQILVPGDSPLEATSLDLVVNQAVKYHSKQRPRIVIQDFNGNGGFDYPVSDFSDWAEDFSVIKQVEYPVDDTLRTPNILRDLAWSLYKKPAGKFLRFLEDSPLISRQFRVTYTALHIFDADGICSINPSDEEAVQALAAAYYCEMLATYYAQNQDSTIQADSVDHKSKTRDYTARAKSYRQVYFSHIGVAEGETVAASVTRDQDAKASWQSDKMTHQQRFR